MTAISKLPPKRGASKMPAAPSFHAGTVLEADQLNLLGENARGMIRLLLRSLLGCGVICGLVVRPEEKCSKLHLHVGCGVAVDCCGDLIEVPRNEEVVIDLCDAELPEHLWVVLKRHEKPCAPRAALCADDDEETNVLTQVRAGYEIRVMDEKPECACACEPEAEHEPESEPDTAQPKNAQGRAQQKSARYGPSNDRMKVVVDETEVWENECLCANPKLKCHEKHYAGECCCGSGGECCNCEWIVLARVRNQGSDDDPDWVAEHAYRRFIRPVLMRDPKAVVPQANI